MISNETTQYPRKRALKLSIEVVGGETLIYNEETHKASCLNEVASAIWQQIDGRKSVQQIAEAAAVSEGAVELALQQFEKDGLIEALPGPIPAALLSRRQMAIKLGLGAAMALPIVATIAAPKAAQAYNGCVDC